MSDDAETFVVPLGAGARNPPGVLIGCLFCAARFDGLSLSLHERVAHAKAFRCRDCNRKLSSREDARRHSRKLQHAIPLAFMGAPRAPPAAEQRQARDACGRTAGPYSYTILNLAGDCVYSYYGDAWGAVEDLLQQFAEGLIAGVPAGSHPDLAEWLGHYRLFWGDWELVEGMNMYEDVRPINATFTLVYIPEPRRRGPAACEVTLRPVR